MTQTFFFYDLETSGLNPREDRIMQFAGQRTDMDLNPIGEPYNFLIRLANDVLPSPEAILTTKITPRQTLDDGYTEAEAAKLLQEEIFTPDTIAVGYNNVRFDDEFVRNLFWRNYYDPYEWSYRDGRSRWDLLDVVRMVRAIRPDGIEWPVDDEGRATNRLEFLSKANGLEHEKAHDALSDVEALISVARLIKQKQPKIWQYLFGIRDKNEVMRLVNLADPKPFVYSSGRLSGDFEKTSVMIPIASVKNNGLLVYDLRQDPTVLIGKTADEIAQEIADFKEQNLDQRPPMYIKELKANRCPAVAPIGVLDEASWKRIGLDLATIKRHLVVLRDNPQIADSLKLMHENQQAKWVEADAENAEFRLAEARLYDGFADANDKFKALRVTGLDKMVIADFVPEFNDERLNELWLGYKARSFERLLTEAERSAWEERRLTNIQPKIPQYLESLAKIAEQPEGGFYADDLKLWLESLLPE